MWPSLVKIQYTELKLSCGNNPVVNNFIYSNGDFDLWPNDPIINRVLPLQQGNHVAKFGQDPVYRTKVIMRKRPCCQQFYWKGKNPISYGVIRSKVKVTYCKYNFWQQGRFRTITLVLSIGSLTNLATWFPFGSGRTLFILGSLGQRSRSTLL
jgi:hypothetical protein